MQNQNGKAIISLLEAVTAARRSRHPERWTTGVPHADRRLLGQIASDSSIGLLSIFMGELQMLHVL
jgi:hypothetical protein